MVILKWPRIVRAKYSNLLTPTPPPTQCHSDLPTDDVPHHPHEFPRNFKRHSSRKIIHYPASHRTGGWLTEREGVRSGQWMDRRAKLLYLRNCLLLAGYPGAACDVDGSKRILFWNTTTEIIFIASAITQRAQLYAVVGSWCLGGALVEGSGWMGQIAQKQPSWTMGW